MIVWSDVETTDLNEQKGILLEVAFVVTDDDLKERAAGTWVIDPCMKSADIPMKLVVREMHEKSGLLADIDAGKGSPLDLVTRMILDWFGVTFGDTGDLYKIPLAGSTISFDRRWMRHHMEPVEKLFSYRSIDVSALTEIADRWNKPVYAHRPKQDKHVPHRALDDVRNSIDYLRYYRAVGFLSVDESVLTQAERHVAHFKGKCPFAECVVCTSGSFEDLKK